MVLVWTVNLHKLGQKFAQIFLFFFFKQEQEFQLPFAIYTKRNEGCGVRTGF